MDYIKISFFIFIMASILFSHKILAISTNSLVQFFHFSNNNASYDLVSYVDLNSCDLRVPMKQGEKQEQQSQQKHLIISSAFSDDGKFLAIATASKFLLLFDVSKMGSAEASEENAKFADPAYRQLPKTPARVRFLGPDRILLSDRSGSLYEFQATESNLSEGRELLGHLSMLLDFCLSPDSKFILTADRDEKIRVSRFPEAYIIESYCLGHTSFVNTVACLDNQRAVSAGGDSVLKLWDFPGGKCIRSSPKICDSPVRKIATAKFKDSHKILVLPNDRHWIGVVDYNAEDCTISDMSAIGCQSTDEKIADFCIDQESGTVFCLGRNGCYAHSLESTERLLRPVKLENRDEAFWQEVAACEDKYPLEELYKVVSYGNVQNYERSKAERVKRKRSPSKEP